METLYFLILSVVGGLLALFFGTGWTSYKEKKIPALPILFRWFVAGLVSTGLAAYTWIFGYGGNVTDVLHTLGGALEIPSISVNQEQSDEITIGLPKF
jgi:hypothetical protein